MEKASKRISPLGFFALIAILFNLFFCHPGACSAAQKGSIQIIAGIELVPIHKWPIRSISALHEKFNSRNISHMSPVKSFARLDLEQICLFMDGHELVIQNDGFDRFQVPTDAILGHIGKKTPPTGWNRSSNNRTGRPSFRYRPVIGRIINRHPDCPARHIISILQRKNCWHQSSDDEPLPHTCS
jgi:hypothetical protein